MKNLYCASGKDIETRKRFHCLVLAESSIQAWNKVTRHYENIAFNAVPEETSMYLDGYLAYLGILE